jgi:hypothetical protein
MADLIIPADPTLAAFHEPAEQVERRMVYYAQTLTATGEAHTVRVERPAIREEAPLRVEVITEQDHE